MTDSEIRSLLKKANLKGLLVYAKARLRPNEKELVKEEISKRLDYMIGVDMYNISTLEDLKIVQDDEKLFSKIRKISNAMIKGNRNSKKASNNAYYKWAENHLRSQYPEPPSEPVITMNHASNGSNSNESGSNGNESGNNSNGKMQRFLNRSRGRRSVSRNRRAASAGRSRRAASAGRPVSAKNAPKYKWNSD